MIYIYCFHETTKYSQEPPTDVDLEAIANGELTVLKVFIINDGDLEIYQVGPDGELEEAEEAETVMTHGQEWHE